MSKRRREIERRICFEYDARLIKCDGSKSDQLVNERYVHGDKMQPNLSLNRLDSLDVDFSYFLFLLARNRITTNKTKNKRNETKTVNIYFRIFGKCSKYIQIKVV